MKWQAEPADFPREQTVLRLNGGENTGKTGLDATLECGAGGFCNGGMDEGLAERRRFDRRNAQRSGSL